MKLLIVNAFTFSLIAGKAAGMSEFGDMDWLTDLKGNSKTLRGARRAIAKSTKAPAAKAKAKSTKAPGGKGKSSKCDPTKVNLSEYPQWKDEEGYWLGELSFYGDDGKPNVSTTWPYNYQSYKGFITSDTACNKFRQRNIFLYPSLDENVEGSSKIFFADQSATDCEGSTGGPFTQNGITLDTKTSLIGQDNALLYQVYWPPLDSEYLTCEESLFQSQLTTLNTLPTGTPQRTRTAQGFNPDCVQFGKVAGKQSYSSFYRETKVTKEEFYVALRDYVIAYNIPQEQLGAYDGAGSDTGNYGFDFVEAHLESSFDLKCD